MKRGFHACLYNNRFVVAGVVIGLCLIVRSGKSMRQRDRSVEVRSGCSTQMMSDYSSGTRSDSCTENRSDCTEMKSDHSTDVKSNHSADVKCDSSTDSRTDVAEVTDVIEVIEIMTDVIEGNENPGHLTEQ